nr:tetratricopeptide repeat protein [Microbulbifer variabilis]
MRLRHEDVEALTYKADAVLELNEPQWAANLCQQALGIDPDNSHAFYQLACAYTAMEQFDEALRYLAEAIKRRESYRDEILSDNALQPLAVSDVFKDLDKVIAQTPPPHSREKDT